MENLYLQELMIKERMLKQEIQKEYVKIGIIALIAALIILEWISVDKNKI